MLLSRVADAIYWSSRYLERAEDTARLVRSYTETIVDLPVHIATAWSPLLSIVGSRQAFDAGHLRAGEQEVVRYIVADTLNSSSVVSSITDARENLRSIREVFPREAWQTLNGLYLATVNTGESAVSRRTRDGFLARVASDAQRFDGILASSMTRDEAYQFWRLGEALERADMTTRVLGVRAASLLDTPHEADDHDEVQWMGVLRSLMALQMYQRAVRGPISGAAVVRFVLWNEQFPRSVAWCVRRATEALDALPRAERTVPAADAVRDVLATLATDPADGAILDAAMERVQVALADLSGTITDTFASDRR
jgi:uncharacterized alpha-E superfamily protein